MAKREDQVRWLAEPEAHDYPAAESYLSLIYDQARVRAVVERLRGAPLAQFKAKDIFRASELALLGLGNSHIEKNLRKIAEGTALSPLLLVRDEGHGKVIVADGYHRLCAVYSDDEDALIPARIVAL